MDKKIKKKNFIIKNKYTIVSGLIIIGLIIFQFSFTSTKSRYKININKISIDEVSNGLFQDYITVTGTVEPIKTIYLDAIEGGRVEEIFIEEGSSVKRGDIILKLDNPKLELEISNYEAQVNRSINELRVSKLNMHISKINTKNMILVAIQKLQEKERIFTANKILIKKNYISKINFENSKDEYKMALGQFGIAKERKTTDSLFNILQLKTLEFSISRMQKSLIRINKRMENLYLKSPTNGDLAQLDIKVGKVISYGENIGKINILDSYKLRLEIDQHYISKIKKGLTGECYFGNKKYIGKIQKIYREVTLGIFFADMVFISKAPKMIKIGQNSRIKLELDKSKNALLIPKGPFFKSTGGQWVYIITKGNIAIKRNIEIGRYNPKYYEIISGLKEGDKIITSSYDLFGNVEEIVLK